MRGKHPFRTRVLSATLLALFVVTGLFGSFAAAPQAQAQMSVFDPGANALQAAILSHETAQTTQGAVQTANTVKQTWWQVLKISLTNTAALALLNGVNYFAQKVAYDAAVYISSGGNGQKPFFTTEGLGNYLQNTALDAAGEAFGTLSEDPASFGKYGVNLCLPKDPRLALNIKLGFLRGLPGILGTSGPTSPTPKCSWDSLASNWQSFVNQDTDTVLQNVGVMFLPGESSLSAAIELNNVTLRNIANKKLESYGDYLANKGFKPVRDFISRDIKTPASTIEKQLDISIEEGWKKNDRTVAITQSAIGNAAWGVIPAALQTFAGALSEQLLKKVFEKGLISISDITGSSDSKDKTLTFDALPPFGGRAAAELANASLLTPKILSVTNYSELTDFATCPDQGRGANHCVMDTQFYNAVSRADQGTGLTLRQAVQQGMLSRNWQLLPLAHRKNLESTCYKEAFCYTNLVKLRRARIIPIGWELAANSTFNDVNRPVTLGEAMDRFEDCPRDAAGHVNEAQLPDPLHPWCHLVDPEWVLKYPSSICRQQAPGPTLISSQSEVRSETCVDAASCITEDASGNCVGGYGYCVREKSVWKLDADSCPAQYSSCTVYNRADGAAFPYLANTTDAGACNSQNAGCRQYSLSSNAVPNPGLEDVLDGEPRDWVLSPGARLHRSGTLSAHGMNAVGVFAGQGASVPISSLQPGQNYTLSAAAVQELEGTNAVATVRLSFFRADGSPVAASTLTTSCDSDPQGRSVSFTISATALGYLQGSCQVLTPPDATSGRLSVSSDAPAAGNRTWIDDLGLFGASFSASPYDGIFLNAKAQKCAAGDAGCTEFVRLTTGSLNLVRNSGFESIDTVTGGPRFWRMDAAKYEKNLLKGSEGVSSIVLSPTDAMQDVHGLLADAAYSFSVAARYDGAGAVPDAVASVQLYDTSVPPQPVSPATVDGCDLSGAEMRLTLPVAPAYQRGACSFTTPADVGFARIILKSDSAVERVLADAVQLELSVNATPYHDGYAPTAERVMLKRAPDGLDCTGTNRPSECDKYAPSCRREEVGCNAYAPVGGGTTIPAVTTANDACPAECAGYDTFKQEATNFNAERFPLFLIPTSAASCSTSESGCTEFTNIEKLAQGGEAREYYKYLRFCTKPDAQTGTFYTWEGSDERGYQLRSWSLRKSNIANVAVSASDPTGGNAPCTKLAYDATGTPRCADDQASVDAASCAKSAIAFNPDCREFYDVDGNIHYRLYSKTVLSSDACKEYRITQSTENECRDHGGRWQNGECRYLAYAPENLTCSATGNKCRSYSGNASRNVRVVFTNVFENGTTEKWVAEPGGGNSLDVVNSNEAVSAGGHSLKVTRASVTRNVANDVRQGKSYLLSFWAKGTGDLKARFTQAGDQSFTFNRVAGLETPVALTTEWRPYQIGPVTIVRAPRQNANDPSQNEQLVFERLGAGAPLLYLDNVELREVTENVYLIEDSWKTPATCDQTPTGVSAPQYALGCRAYKDRSNAIATFKSFEQLCRPEVVGCEALYNTHNSDLPFAETYRAVCSLAAACVPGAGVTCPCLVSGHAVCQVTRGATSCRYDADEDVPASRVSPTGDTVRVPADNVEYLVNDKRYRCDLTAIGCTAMGDKKLNSERTAVDVWNTVYLRNLPSSYASTLCAKTEEFCQAYTRKADGAPAFFKDPEQRVCEYRDSAVGNRGWFKQGTDEPCYANFLEAGNRYGIWKNSDADYRGWVGLCQPQFDMCKEFIDPVATSPEQPRGTPYYAILNDRLDLTTCQNRVSLNQSPASATTASACVLFWQTDNLTKTFSASSTYAVSDAQHGALVAPVSGGAFSDSNVVIRVTRDRQCGQWLDCRSSETVFNQSSGQYQNVCTSYGLCAQFERVGNTTRCVRYVNSDYSGQTLTPQIYEKRDVSRVGMEYSGYAIPNRYPVDQLVTVNVGSSSTTTPDLRLVYVGSACNGAYGSDCGPAGNKGTCLGPNGSRLCVYPIDGGRRVTSETQLHQPQVSVGYPGAACRAYPQEDAPFPSAVADPNGWNYEAAELNNGNPVLISPSPAFAGANVCQRRLVNGVEVSSCECNYLAARYGSEKKYFPPNSSDIPTGYCVGGGFAGYECNPLSVGQRSANNLSCCTKTTDTSSGIFDTGCKDGAQCVRLTKVDRVVGYEGQCLERDMTRPVNGTSDQYACLTWRPVGLIGGSRDIYNQNQSAGYFAAADRRFYCVGQQNAWSTQFNINSTVDWDNRDNINGTVVGPYDQFTNKFFGPGKITNARASATSGQDCQHAGAGQWCQWPGISTGSHVPQLDAQGKAVRCDGNNDCSAGNICSNTLEQNASDPICIAEAATYYINDQAVGILGCYEVADEGSVDGTYIDFPYIGPPLYKQQLQSIYFQITDDIYDYTPPLQPGEIRVPDDGSGHPDLSKVSTNPNQDVLSDCNDEGDDNIDNDDNDGIDSSMVDIVDLNSPDHGRTRSVFHLNETNGWKVDPSDSEGAIVLSATFGTNGLLQSVRVAAADFNDEGAFGINRMGFLFKPGCEQIAQVDQPGEFGATIAFTDAVNGFRSFDDTSLRNPLDTSDQEWKYQNACKPYGAVGAISQQPPAQPWSFVAARPTTDVEQCSVTDFMQAANYRIQTPESLPTVPVDRRRSSLRTLFRKVYAVWDYVKLAFDGGGNTYTSASNTYDETGTVDAASLGVRSNPIAAGFGQVWYPPRVAAVDTTVCDSNGRCKVARTDSMSINGHTEGTVLGADGAMNVTAKFYAWASHNSMPIQQRTMLWSDFTLKEPPAKGWYKNQKPFCSPDISDANAVGECTNVRGLTCDNDSDCLGNGTCNKHFGNHFGNVAGACSAGTFQFDHTYTCTRQDLQAMPACAGPVDAANNAPCYRLIAGTPTCIYRPKVQIVDNWGWCNCTGTGCATDGGAYKNGCRLANPPANAQPWTEYAGEIRLSPTPADAAGFVPGGGGGGGGFNDILLGIIGGSDIFTLH